MSFDIFLKKNQFIQDIIHIIVEDFTAPKPT